jgi:hypothetical protein
VCQLRMHLARLRLWTQNSAGTAATEKRAWTLR